MTSLFCELKNPGSAPIAAVPRLAFADFRKHVIDAVNVNDWRVSSFFAKRETDGTCLLIAVLADDAAQRVRLASGVLNGKKYDSLTRSCAAFHWFEREIYENTGIVPEGHPWLKPIRFNRPENCDLPGVTNYFTMNGDAAHEVAVGPVHAGVIEPGHFRFQCMGEDVFSLEISLGYQHRGIEKMLVGAPDKRTLPVMETVSGDSSTSYAACYCQILEALDPDCRISERAQAIRAVAWELERIANHVGDLGALAGDVAFLTTSSYCGRIRGEFLNMTAAICGNRFGRGLITPSGAGFELDEERIQRICEWIDRVTPQLFGALELMFDAPSVLDRFENTGKVASETAREIGMVGMAARAGGLRLDVRSSHPYGWYRQNSPAVEAGGKGDVFSRADVRRRELAESIRFVRELLTHLPAGDATSRAPEKCLPDHIAVSLVEAWRGELCHTAITGSDGKFTDYKIVDPSFHNWYALALALRGEQISDFPICNKSFNLSYCGHDL